MLSKWDKLTANIKNLNRDLRFDELAKALIKIGYSQNQPKSGSSHYTFRKKGKEPLTMPKATLINKAYIEMVRDVILEYEREEEETP